MLRRSRIAWGVLAVVLPVLLLQGCNRPPSDDGDPLVPRPSAGAGASNLVPFGPTVDGKKVKPVTTTLRGRVVLKGDEPDYDALTKAFVAGVTKDTDTCLKGSG